MKYISVKQASVKFGISEEQTLALCEQGKFRYAQNVDDFWIIPESAKLPGQKTRRKVRDLSNYLTLSQACAELSVSVATGYNWIKLNKLVPDHIENKKNYFTASYISRLKKEIKSGKNLSLKSRRNKKFISGSYIYNSYVSKDSSSIEIIAKLLENVDSHKLDIDTDHLRMIMAETALSLIVKRLKLRYVPPYLPSFFEGKLKLGCYERLIGELVGSRSKIRKLIDKYGYLLNLNFDYQENEDTLGLVYISCRNIENRKATGTYYTPAKVVDKIVNIVLSSESYHKGDNLLDPCCGTGNFLLKLPSEVKVENIYGNDIDDIAVTLTRINLALKYRLDNTDILYKNITNSDYLTEFNNPKITHILGNPPWGYAYTSEDKNVLKHLFSSAQGSTIESYDVFLEKSIMHAKNKGTITFVLPEAILNVKTHHPVREKLIENTSILSLNYLGNAFDKVQCPCIIMQLEKTSKPISCINMKVSDGQRNFVIRKERYVDPQYLNFKTDDDEEQILSKIFSLDNLRFLKDNAQFALGIVTGNNNLYISSRKSSDNEVILKGSDVFKYRIDLPKRFITFNPEHFQQVAPESMYRAKEKLIYRFISKHLVFAYDDKQTLSLNSSNIVIPQIEGLSIKYILSILNSSIAQFIYDKRFNSVKVLRAHIESIPIPMISHAEQEPFIRLVEEIMACRNKAKVESLYRNLDAIIFSLFNLDEEQKALILDACDMTKFL
ncbi:Type I restriction-modification system, DNA methylase subunit [Succinivibrio dextrinosolvens]|uniref:TaqI-like C-terminal specificity domain-containing protein n=1 Tax=Succinivibrio dextrinosolvens TaxID=83771 RepID=UPI0008E86727|nr:TaqI-like C-terminal specificity domain-containing protein [Succinivibrio dextrinosolvens]SFS41878.1 Type I restriction-modification system, DNA methylase subunit [Succinivibrio dextrinosolvens]